MDALSDVLQAVRLKGAVFFDVHAGETWVAEAPPGSTIVSSIFPGSDHLMSYHIVTRGFAWAYVVDGEPIRLEAGDVVVFPHGHPHVLASTPGLRTTPNMSIYRRPEDGHLPFSFSMNGEGEDASHIVCGFLGCDARPFNPLLDALPPVIRMNQPAGGTIGALARFASEESKGPRLGGETVLGRLSELMLVDVLRRYLDELPSDRTGWLAGLRDPVVGRALAALHRSPARAWTLDLLAHEVGVSRSVLAERFSHLVGRPPVQYLAGWRMQLASRYLTSSTESVAAVAERVGYESEAAFSRAFKKMVGESPSGWRKRQIAS